MGIPAKSREKAAIVGARRFTVSCSTVGDESRACLHQGGSELPGVTHHVCLTLALCGLWFLLKPVLDSRNRCVTAGRRKVLAARKGF